MGSELQNADAALASGALIARAGDWLSAEIGDELVMMSAESGRYVGLSETGRRVWELLETPRSLASLCAALTLEYEATPQEVQADVIAFLHALIEKGAVSLAPAP